MKSVLFSHLHRNIKDTYKSGGRGEKLISAFVFEILPVNDTESQGKLKSSLNIEHRWFLVVVTGLVSNEQHREGM